MELEKSLISGSMSLLVLKLLVSGFILLLTAVRADWFGIRKGAALAVLLGIVTAGIAAVAWMIHLGYWERRLTILFRPELDPYGGGYQAMTVRTALAGAQWLGEGSLGGRSGELPYERFVPACDTDFFLTTVIHKLGWLPFLLLVFALTALFCWMLRRWVLCCCLSRCR